MKKLGFMPVLIVAMMSCLCLASCGSDDEPGGNGGGATSGKVKIGDASFSVKYGYIVEEDYDEDDSYFEITCTDTDMSDAYKGKNFQKTVTCLDFYVETYRNSTYMDILGMYKCYFDSRNETVECREKDSFVFLYDGAYKFNVDGKKYTFSGTDLPAEIYRPTNSYVDFYDEDPIDTRALTFSVTTTPVDMTKYIDYDDYDYYEAPSRSIQWVRITDPAEKARFRALFGHRR